MEQRLWTFDDIRRFMHHPDHPVRNWALERQIDELVYLLYGLTVEEIKIVEGVNE